MNEMEPIETRAPQSKQSDIGETLLKQRHLLKDSRGQVIETADQMYMRVATAIAGIDLRYEVSSNDVRRRAGLWYELMAEGMFLLNTPTPVNAGRPDGQLSACFVLPIRDSITETFEALAHVVTIKKASGGTGFAFL